MVYVEKASVIGSTMANEQSFTPEEWAKVLESAMLAGIAVSEAEPSGLWERQRPPRRAASSVLEACK